LSPSEQDIRDLVARHNILIPDIDAFCASLRKDFEIYARDRLRGNINQIHDEIKELYCAAERNDAGLTIKLFCDLSPEARDILEHRAQRRPDLFSLDPAELSKIAALCRTGGTWTEGRKRPSGKRSRIWSPLLFAPDKDKNFAKREAERMLIINMQLTWLAAMGEAPATTADPRKAGPFARFAQDCFRLAGAGHVNVVKNINAVARDRKIFTCHASKGELQSGECE
jgi:hypothetical protein